LTVYFEMKHFVMSWSRAKIPVLRIWWTDRSKRLLHIAVVFLAALALLKLGDEFRRLIWESGRSGAIDLRILHELVYRWFAGRSVYDELITAVHPPGTYAILWPLLGWLAVAPARWLWAATTVAVLGWLAYLTVRESGADTSLERVFAALMLFSMNATGVTIGNGQLIVHLLPVLVAGLLLLQRGRGGWREDLLAAAMLLVTLAKPSVSVPFFWIVLFISGRLRPALFVALGYVALTLFAASFQEPGLGRLLRGWLANSSALAVRGGYANLHVWLFTLGLEQWILPASLLALMALGFWTYRHRHGDFWLLLGVAALVGRFWTYHRLYDDLLILLPMVTLFRIAKRSPSADGGDVVAGVLLAFTILAMLAPARLRYAPWPWYLLFTGGHALVWVAVLIFLLDRARRERDAGVG
jgi:hypothetical protein